MGRDAGGTLIQVQGDTIVGMVPDKGDISYLNAIAYVILTKHPEAVMPESWLNKYVKGWKKYIQGIKARYSPQQVVERLNILDRGRSPVKDIETVAGALFAQMKWDRLRFRRKCAGRRREEP